MTRVEVFSCHVPLDKLCEIFPRAKVRNVDSELDEKLTAKRLATLKEREQLPGPPSPAGAASKDTDTRKMAVESLTKAEHALRTASKRHEDVVEKAERSRATVAVVKDGAGTVGDTRRGVYPQNSGLLDVRSWEDVMGEQAGKFFVGRSGGWIRLDARYVPRSRTR